MGQDKGLILLDGKPMIQHVIDNINPICDQVLISANDIKYEEFGHPVYEDIVPGIGPAGGIISCLDHSKSKKNIIISCDLPYASTNFIRKLIDLSGDSEITLPKTGPYFQPLCAVYSKDVYRTFRDCIKQGMYSLKSIIMEFQIQIIEQDDIPEFELAKELKNINTPEDLENQLT